MLLSRLGIQRRRLIKSLRTGRHIHSRIPGEKINGFKRHLHNLTGHDGEILDAGHVVYSELDVDDDVVVEDVFVAGGPGSHACAAAGLVCVLASGVEFAVDVFDDVDVMVCEFGAFVVVAVCVGEHVLEWWSVDFVAD